MRFSLPAIIDWLRAGYPEGVPHKDYIALFGVLQRHLTDEEVVDVARTVLDLNGDGKIDDGEIRVHLAGYLKGPPSEEDVRRVAAHLAAGGWPLVGFNDDGLETP
ncbi:DUF3349 domain-containing protein [Mobilicoccus pelagius]|uniref:EF-hand domain-containing protein n=1 Tax=Mobilicoccus pelagius NBRC 104925 TaxID=1089455 RepID=H5URJ4_9MICO|nr:DUF3349 domain-containing protein [Mobilicoccus pelagius]GAB48352.1 hypothetical protein MOPEL_071_00680 [Mobilicoccus pelagius NBRC 104925]